MKYFAYGSNMLTGRIRARVPSASNPIAYALRGYRLRFHKRSADGSAKCNIVDALPDDVVHGVLFEIEAPQKADLDAAEQGYDCREIAVSDGDFASTAFMYVARHEEIDEASIPYRWYLELIWAGAEQHALPEDYVSRLKAVACTEDPEPNRKTKLEAETVLEQYRSKKTSVKQPGE